MLYKNGGPIVTVKIENEYPSYVCNHEYTNYLRDKLFKHLGQVVVLFTTDGPGDHNLGCGKVENTLLTFDFGPGKNANGSFITLRKHQKSGPLVNSEYYVGWLDHWQEQQEIPNKHATPLIIFYP